MSVVWSTSGPLEYCYGVRILAILMLNQRKWIHPLLLSALEDRCQRLAPSANLSEPLRFCKLIDFLISQTRLNRLAASLTLAAT